MCAQWRCLPRGQFLTEHLSSLHLTLTTPGNMSIMRLDQFPLKDWRLINVSLLQFSIVSIICICLNLWNPQWLLFLNILSFCRTLSSTPTKSQKTLPLNTLIAHGWYHMRALMILSDEELKDGEIWVNASLKLRYCIKALPILALPICVNIWTFKNVTKVESGALNSEEPCYVAHGHRHLSAHWFSGTGARSAFSVCVHDDGQEWPVIIPNSVIWLMCHVIGLINDTAQSKEI